MPHIIIRHSGDPLDRVRDIILPENLSYSEVELHSLYGNIMLQTSGGILLIYRGSNMLHWIVEGNIISYSQK